MQLRRVFQDVTKRQQIAWGIIEQDYVLSWLLYGIAHTAELKGKLVFKGGTALKKIYFGDYRFSQDLDFTALEDAPKGKALELYIGLACEKAQAELARRISNPIIICARYTEKRPHPNEQEAFVVRVRLPWHNSPFVRVMIEVTFNQCLVNAPLLKGIIHGYPEDFGGELFTYTLNEIFAEKLLAMHLNAIKLHEQGWSRSRARDYFDLWRLMRSFREQLDERTIRETLLAKYKLGHVFKDATSFFDPVALGVVKENWEIWLGQVVFPLPAYDLVVGELRRDMDAFFDWE